MYLQAHNNQEQSIQTTTWHLHFRNDEHDTTRTTWHVQDEHDTARTLSAWHEHMIRDMNNDGTSMQHV